MVVVDRGPLLEGHAIHTLSTRPFLTQFTPYSHPFDTVPTPESHQAKARGTELLVIDGGTGLTTSTTTLLYNYVTILLYLRHTPFTSCSHLNHTPFTGESKGRRVLGCGGRRRATPRRPRRREAPRPRGGSVHLHAAPRVVVHAPISL